MVGGNRSKFDQENPWGQEGRRNQTMDYKESVNWSMGINEEACKQANDMPPMDTCLNIGQ